MKATRFLRTPKGTLIAVFTALLGVAGASAGFAHVMPLLLGGVLPCAALDTVILRTRHRRWMLPSGAILTGIIVAMVLSPFERWYVAAITGLVGVGAKYVFRARRANVFNPAALGLVATFYAFHTAQSWWGGLPDVPYGAAIIIAAGAFVAHRVDKLPAVLVFLATHFLLFTVTAFVGDPASVAEMYRTPDLHAALYFAFFIVSDPPTSPARRRDQASYAVIAAACSYVVFELTGAAYFLLAGVLVANIWESWRRVRHHAQRVARAAPIPAA